MSHRIQPIVWTLITVCMSAAALQLWAVVEPPDDRALDALTFRHQDLTISDAAQGLDQLPAKASARTEQALAALGIDPQGARVDARGGRFETLLPSRLLLTKRSAPGQSRAHRAQSARDAFAGFLNAHGRTLGIDPGELTSGRVTVHGDGSVVQIHMQRLVDGVPVRGSYVSGVINHGKLNLFGAQRWGDVKISTQPQLTADDALATATEFLRSNAIEGAWGKTRLLLIPTHKAQARGEVGNGYGHRLVWALHPTFKDDLGSWELLVDAHSGEVISFADQNVYSEIKGGVYPVTNDGIVPDGVEQPGWPMPFNDVQTGSGTQTSDTGGNVSASGSLTSNLDGPFVRMNDNCGAISLTQSGGIDFGTSGGDDCVTPGFGGAGNTHSSRTGFYELNKMIEMAKGWLPTNTWLQQQLTANMNINNTCNAFWNGVTINFYRSGGGCFNTGEIAGVFDHEWGHGMDANDTNPGIASPSGEGIADIYTALRLNDSCIGRNFRSTVCTGNGDPCLTCTGVRDIDYLKRQSGNPHDYSWSNANCGGSVHCVGGVYSEAVWSLWKRKLQSAPYNYDNNTAYEIVNRMTFIGAGNVGTWFSGGPPFGGCGASGGYLNYLAVDDDDGDLNNGTPHMTAIFEAFDDQEIACNTPTVQDSGCAGTPTAQPVVTATPADKSVGLSWTAVTGASSYSVFRTEGVFGCDFGKVRLGNTTGLTWTDNGLQNGRDYSYVVIPKGPSDSCFGPASSCSTVSPAAGPNLAIDAGSASLSILTGDGDGFLDNCEDATLTFDVNNTGLGGLTNVRLVSAVSTSHPSTTVNTSFPAAVSPSSLPEGGTGSGSFSFTAGGLSEGDTLIFQVEATADEIGSSRFQDLSVGDTESDFQNFASRTFSFEVDLENWSVEQGTFNRSSTIGGGDGTSWNVASSNGLHNQCDRIRSPAMRLSASSTMSLWSNFDIEPFSSSTWYDRANIGLIDSGGARALLTPDGGRLYNADSSGPGNYSGCNDPEEGWAGAAASWASSSWSPTALQSGTFAGQDVRLEVIYATDPALANRGFSFDQVTVTDVDFQVADGQSDTCSVGCTSNAQCDDGLFCNGAETCDLGTNTCQPGTPPNCDDGVACTDDSCNEATDSCDNVANDGNCDNGAFCDGVETCDPVLDCQAGSDPCPGQGCDEAGDVCVPAACDFDGVCEAGEDCNTCSSDCISGTSSGAVCGNGVCETADGEDCVTCAADCNGIQNGKPSGRFCCGNGGSGPVGCGDSRCFDGGLTCTTDPAPSGSYCCGDATCEGAEDSFSCEIDCGPPPCGDGFCDPGTEDQCSCSADCGLPPGSEAGFCTDGVDNDCDIDFDCNDADCAGDPACVCGGPGASCSVNGDCCSNKCKGNGTCK